MLIRTSNSLNLESYIERSNPHWDYEETHPCFLPLLALFYLSFENLHALGVHSSTQSEVRSQIISFGYLVIPKALLNSLLPFSDLYKPLLLCIKFSQTFGSSFWIFCFIQLSIYAPTSTIMTTIYNTLDNNYKNNFWEDMKKETIFFAIWMLNKSGHF